MPNDVSPKSTPSSVFSLIIMFLNAVPLSCPFKLACDSISSAPAVASTLKPMAEAVAPAILNEFDRSSISAAPYFEPAANTLVTLPASSALKPNWFTVAANAFAAASKLMPEASANVTLCAANSLRPFMPMRDTSICDARSEYARAAVSAPKPLSRPIARLRSAKSSKSLPAMPVIELKSATDWRNCKPAAAAPATASPIRSNFSVTATKSVAFNLSQMLRNLSVCDVALRDDTSTPSNKDFIFFSPSLILSVSVILIETFSISLQRVTVLNNFEPWTDSSI